MDPIVHIRVRAILSAMDASARANLKKLLPKKLTMPAVETGKYPSALLSAFPKAESYSLLGYVSEELLRFPIAGITLDSLRTAIVKYYPDYTEAAHVKVVKSKTTQPFLDRIITTRRSLDEVVKGTLVFDTALRWGAVEGHPDAQTETQIFEVKMTGLLKKNWIDFLFQVFAYGALSPTSTDVFLVLPLQSTVWHFCLATWKTRNQYRDALNMMSLSNQVPTALKSPIPGQILQHTHAIGNHVHKGKNVAATILALAPLRERPFQMFLSGPQSTKLKMKDGDIGAAASAQATTTVRLYIHSAYVINLCHEPGTKEDYGVTCLIRNLQYSSAMGLRGVVVHVGKSTTLAADVAEANMRANLLLAMEHATDECPILLETPAGQGTEMLTVYDDFVRFVQSFASPRLRICVDTCHVFASGQNPLEYIQKIHDADPTLLKLVHFNDSAATCGSCLDRHAFIGTGEIGITAMTTIANYCKERIIPMLVE
jgi:deoxyribonuclease-4